MEVRIISADEAKPLRHKVLWPHLEKVEDCVIDMDHRADAIHLGAINNDQVIGICSLFEMSTPKLPDQKQYRLRAMATDPAFRGAGAGRALVLKALELVGNEGYDVLWCDARKVALGFYERLGFDRIDEWYEVRNIGLHQLMFFRFNANAE